MRGEIARARQGVEASLSVAKNALDARDLDGAMRHMDAVESHLQTIEALLRR
jgi:hypothetical protein